jgi:mRNA interferase RelE/StbE
MSYEITFSYTARENFKSLDKNTARRIVQKLETIKEDPYRFVKRLSGISLFSLRVGEYRVIMDIKNKQLLIFVVMIGHRSKVYTKL